MSDDIILEMRDITKTFPGVKALENVNLKVRRGDIHAICGENGAGKSTLMKVLSGVYPFGSYSGDIRYEGQECHFNGIHDSEKRGIVIIHQELALVPMLSIAENMFLGNEQATNGIINWDKVRRRAAELLKKVGLQRGSRHADHQHRYRQAATGGNRQGAGQGSPASDPRRADGLAVGEGQPVAARPARRVQARKA
jgi:ABC-type sugar transport system ATPase subunit